MKTLKQWYDSLSESAQSWIDVNCSAWFDKNQADYYRKPDGATKDKQLLKIKLLDKSDMDKYSDYKNTRMIAEKYITLLKYLSKEHPDLISETVLDECIYQILDSGMSTNNSWLNMTDNRRKEGFKRCFKKWDKMSLANALYLVEDYDNMQFNWEHIEIPALIPEVVEIIGVKEATKLAYDSGAYGIYKMVTYGKENDLFDALFFCGNELSQKTKVDVLERLYADNNSHLPDEQTTEDFFKRIVAVDHCYLRFIYKIIKRYPALAMRLYQQKKPESELTGGESNADQYRYPKELRKLFVIAHMCVLKRVSKVKSSIAKEIAPLLKIYGYKWDDIYDAMYPEDAHLN